MKYNLTCKCLLATLLAVICVCTASAKRPKSAIVAHRGFWNCEQAGYAPNSLASLRCAQEAGFWGSEFDINMTSDGKLLVYHDATIEGKKIDQTPYAEFKSVRLKNGEPIPTLEQYLEQACKCPSTKLVFELKWHSTRELEQRAIELSLEMLKAYGLFSPKRVIFISFSPNACRELAAKAPGFTVQYLGNDRRPAEEAREGVNGMDTWYKTLFKDPTWYTEARDHDMSVNVWTVNDPEAMDKLFTLGVDQLTTDHPLVARERLRELGIREVKGSVKKCRK